MRVPFGVCFFYYINTNAGCVKVLRKLLNDYGTKVEVPLEWKAPQMTSRFAPSISTSTKQLLPPTINGNGHGQRATTP